MCVLFFFLLYIICNYLIRIPFFFLVFCGKVRYIIIERVPTRLKKKKKGTNTGSGSRISTIYHLISGSLCFCASNCSLFIITKQKCSLFMRKLFVLTFISKQINSSNINLWNSFFKITRKILQDKVHIYEFMKYSPKTFIEFAFSIKNQQITIIHGFCL